MLEKFKKNMYWNIRLIECVIFGTVSLSALYYLGTAVDVLGGHHQMTLQTLSFFSPEDNPYGIPYNNWTEKWWHWFYAAPEELADQNSKYTNNDTNLRFLTTVHNFEKVMNVKTTVKQNQAILFSVAKWISLGFPFMEDSKLIAAAKERIDTLEKMNVSVDGELITPDRVMNDVFSLELKRDVHNPKVAYSPIRILRKGKYKAVGDGYWLFIKPNQLSKGEHKIDTFCSCATGVVTIDVHHTLNIV